MSLIVRLEVISGAGKICVEKFDDYKYAALHCNTNMHKTRTDSGSVCSQLGRFTLRDQGQTIAIGKVTKLIE